jgi:CRISPR/Cas system-associated exonuclease Cas4 (RecB family)
MEPADVRTIKASEIGSFLFCQRAWWYNRQGISSENITEMAAGTEIHHKHGRTAAAAGCLQSAAVVFLLAAIVLFVLYFAGQVL